MKFSLEDLVDFEHRLLRDEELDRQSLHERDRKISLELDLNQFEEPRKKLFEWLVYFQESDDDLVGKTFINALKLLSIILCVVGFITGGGLVAGLLTYTGDRPVNVVPIIAIFVFLQLIFLLVWLISALPVNLMKVIPGLLSLQHGLQYLAIDLLPSLLGKLLPASKKTSVNIVLGQLKKYQRLYGRLWFWLFSTKLQQFGFCFNTAAFLMCLYLIFFSDLAFSWSTTLKVEEQTVQQITDVVSIPWAAVWPDAVPDLELIEKTRFFRLNPKLQGQDEALKIDPEVASKWWPFVVAMIFCYGVFPRGLTLVLSIFFFHSQLKKVPGDRHAIRELLHRLNEPILEMHSPEEDQTGSALENGQGKIDLGSIQSGVDILAINWSHCLPNDGSETEFLNAKLELEVDAVFQAGDLNLDNDRMAIDAVGKFNSGIVLIFTKSWETLTRDLENFLKKLQANLSDGVLIHVLPVHISSDGSLGIVEDVDLQHWQASVVAFGDPRIALITVAEGGD